MKRRFKSLEEEMEFIRKHPRAQELLELLKKQDSARTEELMSELTANMEDRDKNEADD